jgi:hypothetical protein
MGAIPPTSIPGINSLSAMGLGRANLGEAAQGLMDSVGSKLAELQKGQTSVNRHSLDLRVVNASFVQVLEESETRLCTFIGSIAVYLFCNCTSITCGTFGPKSGGACITDRRR